MFDVCLIVSWLLFLLLLLLQCFQGTVSLQHFPPELFLSFSLLLFFPIVIAVVILCSCTCSAIEVSRNCSFSVLQAFLHNCFLVFHLLLLLLLLLFLLLCSRLFFRSLIPTFLKGGRARAVWTQRTWKPNWNKIRRGKLGHSNIQNKVPNGLAWLLTLLPHRIRCRT